MKITLATGNQHKVDEINLIAKDYDIEFVLPEGEFNPIEDGKDFIENALCKALCASKISNSELFLADDSGLCIEALNGAPGLISARYAPTAKDRINRVLDELKGIENRNAYFTCAMVVVDKSGKVKFKTQQYCYGTILKEEKGQNGFGYDPIFFVNEAQKAMAELSSEEKSKISHRAKALNKVLEWLKNEIRK